MGGVLNLATSNVSCIVTLVERNIRSSANREMLLTVILGRVHNRLKKAKLKLDCMDIDRFLSLLQPNLSDRHAEDEAECLVTSIKLLERGNQPT